MSFLINIEQIKDLIPKDSSHKIIYDFNGNAMEVKIYPTKLNYQTIAFWWSEDKKLFKPKDV